MAIRVRDFRDLVVWQRATDLAVACEAVCEEFPQRAGNLASQIRRSALSIPANIAEGNGRFSRADYLRHLSMANGSLKELESHLQFAARVHGMTEALSTALSLCAHVGRLLTALFQSLRRR